MVRATSPVRAMVIPGAPGSDVRGRPVAVLRRGDTLATFRASVRGACVMLRKHTAETLPGDSAYWPHTSPTNPRVREASGALSQGTLPIRESARLRPTTRGA